MVKPDPHKKKEKKTTIIYNLLNLNKLKQKANELYRNNNNLNFIDLIMFILYTIKSSTTYLLIFYALWNILILSSANAEFSSSTSWSSLSVGQEQNDLQEMLKTEKHIIDTLRRYIESQELKLNSLKR